MDQLYFCMNDYQKSLSPLHDVKRQMEPWPRVYIQIFVSHETRETRAIFLCDPDTIYPKLDDEISQSNSFQPYKTL